MREGSLDAPVRHPIAWEDADFYDEGKLDAELRRVFDICHGCRRCFNLCDSFPRLFDLIDESKTGELDSVDSKDFKPVVDGCTLCDMCFMTKCPYVPPHEFNLDFPHLMLRYRAVETRKGQRGFFETQLTKTDRNGRVCSHVSGMANWASDRKNRLTRPVMQSVAGVDKDADLPKYYSKTLTAQAKDDGIEVNMDAPGYGRKVALYATCFSNFNNPGIGEATRRILAKNGVETEVVYPSCCGMPQFEHGDLEQVAKDAKTVAAALKPYIEKDYEVVALVPSCALMLKFEWPLIVPGNEDVMALANSTFDVTEYIVRLAKDAGLAEGIKALDGGVTLHIACHARAQNMGHKAADMLRLIPDIDLNVIERCSGHGGSWGVMKGNFETAIKVGKPVARNAAKAAKAFVASECPLAGAHILQGMEMLDGNAKVPARAPHPVELFATAYGLSD